MKPEILELIIEIVLRFLTLGRKKRRSLRPLDDEKKGPH